jgi:hypothetical protein
VPVDKELLEEIMKEKFFQFLDKHVKPRFRIANKKESKSDDHMKSKLIYRFSHPGRRVAVQHDLDRGLVKKKPKNIDAKKEIRTRLGFGK